MIRLNEYDLLLSERILTGLHNLCTMNGERANKSADLAQTLQTGLDKVKLNHEKHFSDRYVAALHDAEESRRFDLKSLDIVRANSLFS